MFSYGQYRSSQAVSTTVSTRLTNQDFWHTWTTKDYRWRKSFTITFIIQVIVNILLSKIKCHSLLNSIISGLLKIYRIIESVITVVKLKIYPVKHETYNTWNQWQILDSGNKKLHFIHFIWTFLYLVKEIHNIMKNAQKYWFLNCFLLPPFLPLIPWEFPKMSFGVNVE